VSVALTVLHSPPGLGRALLRGRYMGSAGRPVISRTLAAGIACVLLHAGSAGAQTREEFCARTPAAGFDRPPNPAYTGRYLNPTYGYGVRIPAPLVAHASVAGPERGFGIVLSWTPRAFLRVDASYDVFYDLTADGVHRSDLNAIRVHDALVADDAARAELDGVPGGHFRFQLLCLGDQTRYLIENILVIRRREVYRIQLQTTPERFERDHPVFEQLAHSWRWLPRR
jgi:hypothetical protein